MGKVSQHALWRLFAIAVLMAALAGDGSGFARAAPAEQSGTVRYVSDLTPWTAGAVQLNKNADGGALKIRTAAPPATTSQTYAKGVGTKSGANVTPATVAYVGVARPAGCTGFAAVVGPDIAAPSAQFTTVGFIVYQNNASGGQTPTNWGEFQWGSVQQTKTLTLLSDTTEVVLGLNGNGMGDWGDVKFTGCPATATPTPTATATATKTPVPPTSTTVPPTATQTPPGSITLGPGQSVSVNGCTTSLSLTGSTLACAPAQTGMRQAIFEDLNLHDDLNGWRAFLVDVKARGFTDVVGVNGEASSNDQKLTVADEVGALGMYMNAGLEFVNFSDADSPVPATIEEARAAAYPVADRFKNHPSFRAYYIKDEPLIEEGPKVRLLAQALRERDPGHGRFAGLIGANVRITENWSADMTHLALTTYPARTAKAECDFSDTSGTGRTFTDYVQGRRAETSMTVPVILILQAHQHLPGGFRYPTLQELRAQARLSREMGVGIASWFMYSSMHQGTENEWLGLHDSPARFDELTRIAQGTSSGPSCDGSATSTPAPITSTSTPTPVPPTATTAPPTPTQVAQSGNGVPQLTFNYGEPVVTFWSRHYANPTSANYRATITRPDPVINVAPGSNLQTVLDTQCPPAGCTLRLLNGQHGRFQIIGRSNVHIVGESKAGTRFAGVQIASCARAIAPVGNYTVLNVAQNNGEQWAIDCINNPHRNFSIGNLTFDGQGAQLSFDALDHLVLNAGLVARTVNDVVVEDVDVTNYQSSNENTPHDGILMGNYHLENFLVRRVNFLQEGKSHIFADGCRGCGVLDSTFPFAGSGAIAYYTNDDATDDLNGNGQYDEEELRLARYIILRGNTIAHNNAFAFAVQGQFALIEGNTTTGFHSDFALLQTRRPFNHPPGIYQYKAFGHVVRNNTIAQAVAVARVDMPDNCGDDAPQLAPDQCLQAGQITVTGNHMIDKGRLISVLMWTFGNFAAESNVPWPANYPKHDPIIVSGNT